MKEPIVLTRRGNIGFVLLLVLVMVFVGTVE